VFGGGSFATAMGAALARQKHDLKVQMLLRAQDQCEHINENHENARYLPGKTLPENLSASTDVHSVLEDAQYVIHAVPVQASRAFLASIKDVLPAATPIICVSKGIEKSTGFLMSELIPSALGRKQACVFLSGPSFAQEVIRSRLSVSAHSCSLFQQVVVSKHPLRDFLILAAIQLCLI
jgi:glycerol-3-phosphate dehydrogenase (NAD+)